ncbi:signal-induced proliferation-associated 1-like protein 2 [Limulus polyphemus]|uniref:Signal-induced proliferation-associated 1-like protein 2 n=1 Tax=Limulus polyphemus TaxID=6850 RepID=A0ABM1C515_LIMPO|nr:signal-induced proliferation-associated 1-like protein 2 [Limulus polyphemus]XP_022237637.1 signal-induced proliferation-associated 1-like protein 2 [Limulus polyphemus]XP_022237644.1 signal-induced proliferation-associated 1-like protein 2 [Limulus polyphemus]
MAQVAQKTESNGSSIGNGLTSEVLRARTMQYYNNCVPQSHRRGLQEGALYKSGSMTRLNGLVNGVNMPPSFGSSDVGLPSSECPVVQSIERPLPPPYPRSDRPHRTHSERTNRAPGEHAAVSGVMNNMNSQSRVGLHRSNSSLDLEHSEENADSRTGVLHRDYGSASSLDVISTTGETQSFFAMLREYKTDQIDQRSPGPAKIHEYLRGKVDPAPTTQNASNALANGPDSLEDSQSPRLKTKIHKFWEIKDKKTRNKLLGSEPSLFKKLRGKSEIAAEISGKGSNNSLDAESRFEDKLRKKVLAHYDCQSITANLSYASCLRNLLNKRRNTTTGASAASMSSRTPNDGAEGMTVEEPDPGDDKSNNLILSCPFFRNELGGEEERFVSLNRITSKKQKWHDFIGRTWPTLHRPSMACGLSVLENASAHREQQYSCPYQQSHLQIEGTDLGAMYYRSYFYNQDHQNWFGVDETLGPIAISIKRERVEDPGNSSPSGSYSITQALFQYRLIVRTSELVVLRGSVLEEAIPSLGRSSSGRGSFAREVLEYVAPELQISCLRLAVPGHQTEEQLLKLDEQGVTKTYKVGVMYCKAGQSTEGEMYNNELSGPAFEEFLEMIGQRVRLKGFEKYRAGLDNKTDTTGLYSVYSTLKDCEIMFHVSTMLPYTPNNRQQLLRKRHIGNDIVTIVFQEPDALPFTPKNIRSHFQHVFIVVRAINPCTENTCYSVAVSRSKDVPVFGPPIPESGTYPKSKAFADFLLTKVINAENAAHQSEKFAMMAQRTRHEYLKDLAANHVTNTTIDSGPKFSILSFGGKKKERSRLRFIPDSYVQGAISWHVQVEDHGQSRMIDDCLLGISIDTVVLIEENSKEVIFTCPCSSVIGWSSHTSSLKIFYHQGECLVLNTKDPDVDEIQEIVSRLACVTQGCETQELILRRNSLGQLGFHVQYEGIVTDVESYGFAWQAGLRQGSRLVEICKVAVATLSYDQMVDLLKTSMTVSVTVIPPLADRTPRRGCGLQNCNYLVAQTGGDYENVGGCEEEKAKYSKDKSTPHQQAPTASKNRITAASKSSGSQRPTCASGQSSSSRSVAGTTRYKNNEGKVNPNEKISRETHVGHYTLGVNGSTRESPPPVPVRFQSASSFAFHEVASSPLLSLPGPPRTPPRHHTNSTSHAHHSSSHVTHYHQPASVHDHGDLESSLAHVGDMVVSRSELSLAQLGISQPHLHHLPFSAASVCSTAYTAPVKPTVVELKESSSMSRESRRGKAQKASPHQIGSDYQSDSSSEWIQGASSADELASTNVRSTPPRSLPHLRTDYSTDPSNNSPRSPHPVGRALLEPSHVKLSRLRPGVTSGAIRSGKLGGTGSSGSSTASNSTLQEDLLKLISPDFLDSDSNSEAASSRPDSVPSESGSHTQLSTPYSSLERSTGGSQKNGIEKISGTAHHHDDVIVTKAQPAQVISVSSHPEAKMSKEERLSPRVMSDRVPGKLNPLPASGSQPLQAIMPLPEGGEIDWPSLVDTATKAIEDVRPPLQNKASWLEELSEKLGKSASALGGSYQLQELEAKINQLQQDLAKEQGQKATLEEQVKHLQEENLRLQEESLSTSAQLRRFTEWFFNNI